MGLSAMNIIRQKKKQGCIIFHRSCFIIIIVSLMFCLLFSSDPYECAVYQDFFFLCANIEIGCVYQNFNEHAAKIT